MSLIFDEATHTYTLGGWKLPSVTQILGQFKRVTLGELRYIVDVFSGQIFPAELFETPADYGTAIHAGCELILTGKQIDYAALDEDLVYPLKQFEVFVKDYNIQPIMVEEPMASVKWGYAGKVDLIAHVLNGNRWILDIKTGSAVGLAGPQLAAYEHLYRERSKFTGKVLRGILTPPAKGKATGTWKLKPMEGKNDWEFFKSRLATHKLLKEIL